MMSSLSFFLAIPLMAMGDPALRGADITCTGTGALPSTPACYQGTALSGTFGIKVVSVDGNVGVADLNVASSGSFAECTGAHFENSAGSITLDSAASSACGAVLGSYDYTVRYCSDQDKLIVHIVKPYDMSILAKIQILVRSAEDISRYQQRPEVCKTLVWI